MVYKLVHTDKMLLPIVVPGLLKDEREEPYFTSLSSFLVTSIILSLLLLIGDRL